MSELMKLLQAADVAAIEYEKARVQVETAKQNLETAKAFFEEIKTSFDEVIARADEHGIARVKMRKLVEERTQLIIASGLIANTESRPAAPKPPRPPKKSKAVADVKDFSDDDFSETQAAEMN